MTKMLDEEVEIFSRGDAIATATPSAVAFTEQDAGITLAVRTDPASWLSDALKAIRSLRALEQNWDSYGAHTVKDDSIEKSKILACSLSEIENVAAPTITATPAGHVGFCWDSGDRSLDAEVYPSGLVEYVYLDRRDSTADREARTRDVGELAVLLTSW